MAEQLATAPEFVRLKTQHTAVVRGEGVPVEDMIRFLDSAFTVLRAAVDAAAIAPDGPAYSRYDTELEGDVTIEAGIPLLAALEENLEFNGVTIEAGELPGGEVARAIHVGPYSELADVWQEFLGDLERSGRTPRKPYWESYLVTPGPGTDPERLRTEMSAPV
ncbi:GyrI-like domain-containing protein [Gulosibacter molinativorax]|uniref:AraC family transcriptional regulator n=1 Tax=Gulosibacter molinativorax TaxID=256821 RepID=A0ABT7C8E8_9MICO|nr:GyrI-like domain-containing protein [Gulosibacter molinativorax]MDJ1371484.1 AraC family transcriptional regulator [Gulosibacter molinativorax]QUY62424.1 Hypotetical protein [Gulosibacter molinativorax]